MSDRPCPPAGSPMLRWLGLAGLALLLAAAVRLPFNRADVADPDEALYWLIGQAWLAGAPPYIGLWDVKPPGLFLVFLLHHALFGDWFAGPRILAALAVTASALGVCFHAAVLLGNRLAGVIGLVLMIAYSVLSGGATAAAEVFTGACAIWAFNAVSLGLRSGGGRRVVLVLLSGLLAGFGCCIKQPVAFDTLYFGLLLLGSTRSLGLACVFAAGCAAAPLGFAAYYASLGQFDALWQATVIGALLRVKGNGLPVYAIPVVFLMYLLAFLPLAAGAAGLWGERRAAGAPFPLRALAGWGLAIAAGIAVKEASYSTYFIPLVAPLSIATGLLIAILARRSPRGAAVRGAVTLLYPIGFLALHGNEAIRRDPLIEPVARHVGALAAGRPVYVIDYQLAVYQLAGVKPPTRFPAPIHLLCDFAGLPVDAEAEIRRIIDARPAVLVVTAGRRVLPCARVARATLAMDLAAPFYVLDRRFGTGADAVEVWRRR